MELSVAVRLQNVVDNYVFRWPTAFRRYCHENQAVHWETAVSTKTIEFMKMARPGVLVMK